VSEKKDQDLPRCLYLLTDGAVSNTEDVVNLIKANNQNCSVNTFGIGSGADESLIKNSAKAGRGHYTFIHQLHEIETKVIDALTKDFYEYLTVKELKVYDDKNLVFKNLMPSNIDLSHGEALNIIEKLDLTPEKYVYNRMEIVIHDPNTKRDFMESINIIEWNQADQVISKAAAFSKINSITDQKLKAIESIKYQILDNSTALLAYEKL